MRVNDAQSAACRKANFISIGCILVSFTELVKQTVWLLQKDGTHGLEVTDSPVEVGREGVTKCVSRFYIVAATNQRRMGSNQVRNRIRARSFVMKFVFRLLLSVPLMTVVAFCLFGFMATFEPMPHVQQWIWRGVYVLAGLAALLAVCWMWLKPRPRGTA